MAHRVLARLERGQLVAAAITERRREVAQQRPRVLAPAVREGRRDEDRAHGVPLARLEEPGHLSTNQPVTSTRRPFDLYALPGTGSSCRRASALRAATCESGEGGSAAAGEGRRGVSGGAGEGARTRSNGRFTRVVNRKAASPSSATPRGSIEWPRGGAHERVELLAARGQRLRARGKRVERRGAQQQGSSVRRPQCCGDAGECGAQRCPHLSFRNRSPPCCSCSLSVSLALLLCKKSKMSYTRAKSRPVPTARSRGVNGAPRAVREEKQHGLETALRLMGRAHDVGARGGEHKRSAA